MGLLGQIIGSVLGGSSQPQPGAPSPMPPGQAPQADSMLSSMLGMLNSSKIGGLSGLMALFQSKGLGSVMSGWVSKGPNPPITPQQLQQAVGDEHIQQFAEQHGMSQQQAASAMAQMLPHVVDNMTPDGTIPPQGQGMDMASILSMLKQKLA